MYFNDSDFLKSILILCVFSALIGAALALGLPVIWDWIKPLIHEVTA